MGLKRREERTGLNSWMDFKKEGNGGRGDSQEGTGNPGSVGIVGDVAGGVGGEHQDGGGVPLQAVCRVQGVAWKNPSR